MNELYECESEVWTVQPGEPRKGPGRGSCTNVLQICPPWKSAAHVCVGPLIHPVAILPRPRCSIPEEQQTSWPWCLWTGRPGKSCATSAPCVGCSCRLTLPLGTKALEKRYARKESARRDEETGTARDPDSLQEQQGKMSQRH